MAKGQGWLKQRGYWGKVLVVLGLVALGTDLSFLLQPLGMVAERSREGLLGLVPTLGMCILNATHAIAFHQIDFISLISRILVLFSAMVAVIAGTALLRPKSKRVQIIELMLSPEREGREITTGSSR